LLLAFGRGFGRVGDRRGHARCGQGVEQAGGTRRDRLDLGVGYDLRFLGRFRLRRLQGLFDRCRSFGGLRGLVVEVELRLAALGEDDVAGHRVVLLVRSGLCVLVAGLGLGTAITAATATAATTAATTAAAA